MRFPVSCAFCGRTSEDGVCTECDAGLSRALRPVVSSLPYTEGALTLFDYEDRLVRRGIFALKNRGTRIFARVFILRALEHVRALGFDFSCVSYVPRRASQRRLCGVDQARVLARALAKELGLPCVKLLSRCGFSRRQHTLGPAERVQNVRGKFRARKHPVQGDVLLVDDIVTTGATATECARVLLLAGARRVVVFAPARGGTL